MALCLLLNHRNLRYFVVRKIGMFRDLRFAFRQLKKSPGFAVVAVITLALGIGASTAIFSVVNPILFRALPYPDGRPRDEAVGGSPHRRLNLRLLRHVLRTARTHAIV